MNGVYGMSNMSLSDGRESFRPSKVAHTVDIVTFQWNANSGLLDRRWGTSILHTDGHRDVHLSHTCHIHENYYPLHSDFEVLKEEETKSEGKENEKEKEKEDPK